MMQNVIRTLACRSAIVDLADIALYKRKIPPCIGTDSFPDLIQVMLVAS